MRCSRQASAKSRLPVALAAKARVAARASYVSPSCHRRTDLAKAKRVVANSKIASSTCAKTPTVSQRCIVETSRTRTNLELPGLSGRARD
jgi:hypothetical protein